MQPDRPVQERFVLIHQPDTFIQSRWAKLHYEDDQNNEINYLVAYDDVYIEETEEKEKIRYATCGQADFIKKKNVILLRKLPQVYQGPDTVTGEVIKINRDTDIVEVDRSNAYSEGEENESTH